MRRVSPSSAVVFAGLLAIAGMVGGCSSHASGPQSQTRDVDGLLMVVSMRPGLPQDIGNDTQNGGAQVGDNTLIVELHDDKTNAPIPDANVSASASTSLVGDQRPESGRAQGNGVYYVPVRFGVPDTYTVTVTVDRTARQETTSQFQFMAG